VEAVVAAVVLVAVEAEALAASVVECRAAAARRAAGKGSFVYEKNKSGTVH
jgi:hypothetical protein